MTLARTATLLRRAALLEAGGDALIRRGLHDRWFLLIGGFTLLAYGLLVNLTGLGFGRAIGSYIAVFFVVSQIIAVLVFRDAVGCRIIAGGTLILAGGCALMM